MFSFAARLTVVYRVGKVAVARRSGGKASDEGGGGKAEEEVDDLHSLLDKVSSESLTTADGVLTCE